MPQAFQDPLQALLDYYQPQPQQGFTGQTGLATGDMQGWSRMLNQQTQQANQQRALQGKGPLGVEVRGDAGPPLASVKNLADPNTDEGKAWWEKARQQNTGLPFASTGAAGPMSGLVNSMNNQKQM